MYCFGLSGQDAQIKAELFMGREIEKFAKGVRLHD
jgi:hypothetical protein